jgi:hypothetical protein
MPIKPISTLYAYYDDEISWVKQIVEWPDE